MEDKIVVYEFGDFHLDIRQRILSRGGQVITLTPKGFEVLLLLVRNHGQILEKEELIRAAWPDSFVEESNLSQNIFVLRKVLGDDRNGHGLIQTIPRRGYKFVAPVRELEAGAGELLFPAGYWNQHSPFRGLQVFEAEDSWLFFGRDAEIEDLLEHLRRSPVLVLIGNSGSGKSSLVRAGLVTALQQGRFQDADVPVSWQTVVVRPSGAPFDYLAEVLPGGLAAKMDSTSRAQFISDCRNKFPIDEHALRNAVGALVATDHTRVLLVVDQFEELFTLTASRAIRDRYIDLLLGAAGLDSVVPVHLVLILRADFYAPCLEHPALTRCLQTNIYNLPRIGRQQLRESIEKRLALAGARAEPGLIGSLLEDAGEEPGNLALLEHALDQLWQTSGGSGCVLTNEAYSNIGGLRGALGKHADEVYKTLPGEEQKQLAQRIFLELVHMGEGASVQETRRRIRKTDLIPFADADEIESLLSHLSSNRLISIGGNGGEAFVEVSHEALIREWPRLREWLNQNREDIQLGRRLLQAAEEWDRLHRDPEALLQGVRLARAEEWLTTHSEASIQLQQFITSSIEAKQEAAKKEQQSQARELASQRELLRQAEARAVAEKHLREQQQTAMLQSRRSALHLRWLSTALAILMLVAAGAAWFAHRQRIFAESRALAAQAEDLLSRDHGRAVDLAIRSWALAKTEEARLVVAKVLAQPLRTFQHESAVYAANFSPDGRRILTSCDDRTARVWSIDGQLLFTLQGHSDVIKNAVFSPDGQRILTASYDHTARIWSATDGQLIAILHGHTDKLQNAHFSPDSQRVVTSSWDHTARIWNAENGKLLTVLSGHQHLVMEAQFSSDGQRVVTASYDKTAKVWDSINGHLVATLENDGPVADARFFPKDDRIITANLEGRARIWDSQSRPIAVLQHRGPIQCLGFSPDASRILTASFDHSARVWDAKDGQLLLTLSHDGPVMHAQVSRDGRHIVTASLDHTARIWNASDGRLLEILSHGDMVYRASFSPDGQQVATSSHDHTLILWSMVTARSMQTLQGHVGPVEDGSFSPDDRVIVTAGRDRTTRVWNAADGRLLNILQGHSAPVGQAVMSPNGRVIATASWDGTAKIWDTSTGHLIATLQGHSGQIERAFFSPDGNRVITASTDHTARLWSASDYRLIAILIGHADALTEARFSPDGRLIATSSKDNTAKVWDGSDGHLITTLQGHTGPVYRVSFSPDGSRIVTASADHTARIWNAVTGQEQFILQEQDQISMAVFSPDGQRVVISGLGNASLWDSADGSRLAVLRGHSAKFYYAMFSPDGKQILTASSDGSGRIWDGCDGHLVTILQGHTMEVWKVVFSWNGRAILTISRDQTARVWHLLTLDDMNNILAQ